jgi:poly(hydroxyalkanoate) depolymerase family esterase
MKTAFIEAMRYATKLTRAQNVIQATQAIQRALLRNGDFHPPAEPAAKASHQPELRGVAAMLELAREEAITKTTEAQDAFAKPRPTRLRKPLGEVLQLLRHAEPPIGRLDLAPQLKARKEPPTPEGAAFLSRRFNCAAGSRDYKIYLPRNASRGKVPLVIMLHGCGQDPNDFAVGTGMNRLAEEEGFIVAYPKQTAKANQSACWNWFNVADQARDAGEPSIIAGITRSIMAEYAIDARRVYVAGLSAGGAMAAVMSATYPDLYAAAGVHSGLAYGCASDVASAFAAMRGASNIVVPAPGKTRSAGARTIIFHGVSDKTVHPSNADIILSAARADLGASSRVTEQGGDTGGRAYVRTVITDRAGVARAEHWAIDGLGHAWSGGNPEGSYTDRHGPDASREMLRFFLSGPA